MSSDLTKPSNHFGMVGVVLNGSGWVTKYGCRMDEWPVKTFLELEVKASQNIT